MASKTATPETEVVETEVSPIPDTLQANPILVDICNRYLEIVNELANYNSSVLKKSDSEWTRPRILEKAKELGRPADPKNANEEIKKFLIEYENAVEQMSITRAALQNKTAEVLGVSLSSTAERDPLVEEQLKEKRKLAVNIASQLKEISKLLLADEASAAAITEFLEKNALPAVGRDQIRSFTADGTPTPKYRVKVVVKKDGNVLLEEDGFAKTAIALSKPVFGYPRGESLKADKMRAAWEAAGNSAGNTVQSPVEFEDNGLHFSLIQK